MTTREKVEKLLTLLSEAELQDQYEHLLAAVEEPDMVPLPDGWGQTRTGEPMPNVVAALPPLTRVALTMLAVDASLAIELCLDRAGDDARAAFADDELVAPPLLWSEVPSVIHELAFRGEISGELSDTALQALLDNAIGVHEVRPAHLMKTAWQIATEFGWAKTYDAEYLATAQLLKLSPRNRRRTTAARADRLGFVVTPSELR